jgi:hypothetical protein
MPNTTFASDRRADSRHAAYAIADRLRWAFGQDEGFLDRRAVALPSSISTPRKLDKLYHARPRD